MGLIRNAGVPGNNTRDMLARLDADVLAHKPDMVILLAGTNDQLNSFNDVPLEEYRRNMATLIERIQGAGSRMLLLELIPCIGSFVVARHRPGFFAENSPEEKVNAANRIVHELGAQYGVPVVNTWAAVAAGPVTENDAACLLRNPANSGATDGVHPTAAGYQAIATAVYGALTQTKEVRGTIVCLGDSITFGLYMEKAGTADPDALSYPGQLAALRYR